MWTNTCVVYLLAIEDCWNKKYDFLWAHITRWAQNTNPFHHPLKLLTACLCGVLIADPHASPLVLIYRYNHMSIWNQGACIGLYFINRPEWIIVDHACSAYSYVSVPLYDTLGMFTTQNDYTIVLLFIYDLSSDSFCVLYICTFRPR